MLTAALISLALFYIAGVIWLAREIKNAPYYDEDRALRGLPQPEPLKRPGAKQH